MTEKVRKLLRFPAPRGGTLKFIRPGQRLRNAAPGTTFTCSVAEVNGIPILTIDYKSTSAQDTSEDLAIRRAAARFRRRRLCDCTRFENRLSRM